MARPNPLRTSDNQARAFRLDRTNRKVFGACSGIGSYFNIDPLLIRIGFVAATLMFGLPLVLYVIIALVAD